MIEINKRYDNISFDYDLESLSPLEEILFLDIETTGFSPASSNLYLIGCGYYKEGAYYICQFFAENPDEEKDILEYFLNFAKRFSLLIHFNGNNFDIPYIQDKCKKYELPCDLGEKKGIDLYRRISPYKNFIKVPNCKQKTLEQYISIDREDKYTGGELIGIYHEYTQNPTNEGKRSLLLHNENDIEGMIRLIPILSYHDLFNKPIRVTRVNMDRYQDFSGNSRLELIMKCALPSYLPGPITELSNGFYFSAEGSNAILKVPVYEEELKYFYANYKDYYFLPEENQALHKSVSSFVDKEHRIQATAATCYTRVSSRFLRQYSTIAKPFFKKDYHSKELYLELTDERKRDRQFFADYASHILNVMASSAM